MYYYVLLSLLLIMYRTLFFSVLIFTIAAKMNSTMSKSQVQLMLLVSDEMVSILARGHSGINTPKPISFLERAGARVSTRTARGAFIRKIKVSGVSNAVLGAVRTLLKIYNALDGEEILEVEGFPRPLQPSAPGILIVHDRTRIIINPETATAEDICRFTVPCGE